MRSPLQESRRHALEAGSCLAMAVAARAARRHPRLSGGRRASGSWPQRAHRHELLVSERDHSVEDQYVLGRVRISSTRRVHGYAEDIRVAQPLNCFGDVRRDVDRRQMMRRSSVERTYGTAAPVAVIILTPTFSLGEHGERPSEAGMLASGICRKLAGIHKHERRERSGIPMNVDELKIQTRESSEIEDTFVRNGGPHSPRMPHLDSGA